MRSAGEVNRLRAWPTWAVIAAAGSGGVLGAYAYVAWWLLVPAVLAAALVAWCARGARRGLGVGLLVALVAIGNASPDGDPRRFVAAATLGGVVGIVVALVTTAPAVALGALAAIGAALVPGPAVPVTGAAAPDGLTPDLVRRIDDYVVDAMAARRVPGVALAVVHDDDLVLARGYGVGGTDRRPMTPDTPFVLASVSKSFTSLAVMQLVEDGLVELDAPVVDSLGWFRVDHPSWGDEITIRHLLNQTSGFDTPQGWRLIERGHQHSLASDVRDLAGVRPTHPPGDRYRYSNRNHQILGALVEEVTGRTYEEYLTEEVLAPLGMAHTAASEDAARAAGLSEGYRVWWGVPVPHGTTIVTGAVPMGGVASSAADMSRYLRAYLGGGELDGVRVLSAGGVDAMFTPGPADPEAFAEEEAPRSAYAMGWDWSEEDDGEVRLSHGGTAPEFSAGMVLVPEEGWGVVALANAQDPLAPIAAFLASSVTDLVTGQTPPDPAERAVATYLVANLFVVAGLAGLVHALADIGRWGGRLRRGRVWRVVLWGVLVNLALPLAILLLPSRVSATWPFVWTYAPGFVLVLVTCAITLLALGVAKIVLGVRWWRARAASGGPVNGGLPSRP